MDNMNNQEIPDLYYFLMSMYPESSILINNEIGLIGYGLDEEPRYKNNKTYNHYNKAEKTVAKVTVHDGYIEGFRGNYFTAIDLDGCLLFRPYVDFVGVIHEKDNSISYLFGLYDVPCEDELLSFLYENEVKSKALVLYRKGELYTNKFNGCEEIGKTLNRLELIDIGGRLYNLYINNDIFVSYDMQSNYDFFGFHIQKMKL